MRKYLVVIDETPEARIAFRFASRRAEKTNGALHILALVPKEDFVAWGAVQATIADEAERRAEALVAGVAGDYFSQSGKRPAIAVMQGDAVESLKKFLSEHDDITALVLGAAASGAPGPLVSHFAASQAGSLPCPVMVIPGGLGNEEIDRLS
ncbi:MAG: universal stress protein [Pseudomonadota bacterium]